MRIAAGVLCAAVAGCSFGMKSVDPQWDGSTEPDCTDDQAPVIGDGLVGGLLIGIGAVAAEVSVNAADMNDPNTAADVVAAGGLLIGLGFAISSAVGESTYKHCHEAKAEWRVGGAIGRASVANRNGVVPESDEQRAKRFAKEHPEVVKHDEPVAPRGFFCSSSPSNASAGFCVRDKAECERTRDVVGADLSGCALVETAWCFGDRCAPDEAACNAARDRLVGPDGVARECVESK